MNNPNSDNSQTVSKILEHFRTQKGALLPILHEIQHQIGYIPPESVQQIATAMNLSRAEVHGVISFYHEFKTEPTGKNLVQVCRGEACQAMGSRILEQHAKDALAIEFDETTNDGLVTLEAVYCLGNCACSPSVRIGDDIYARVDGARFDELMVDLKAGVNS